MVNVRKGHEALILSQIKKLININQAFYGSVQRGTSSLNEQSTRPKMHFLQVAACLAKHRDSKPNCLVWWQKVQQVLAASNLGKMHSLGFLGTTGPFRSTPIIALETLLNLEPFNMHIKMEAIRSAYMLSSV